MTDIIKSYFLYKGKVKIDECKGIAYGKEYKFYQKDGKTLISSSKAAGVMDKSDILMFWASKLTKQFLYAYLYGCEVNQFTREELLPMIDEAVTRYKSEKEKAATSGTRIHDFAEQFVKSKLGLCDMPEIPEDDEKVIAGINAFLDWYNQDKKEFIFAEQILYSLKDDFAGRADAGVEIGGKKYLVDYKTGSNIYSEALLQIASYFKAYTEEFSEESLDGVLILHFNKDTGDFKTKVLNKEQVNFLYPYFVNCLQLRKGESEIKKLL